MKSTSDVKIIGLDHIRAFAALLVFMWHFLHPPFGLIPTGSLPDFFASSIFNEGHTGVALFMTLSGFIFTYLSFNKTIDLKQFYKNRFLRVFPLLFFWCIFGVAFLDYKASDVVISLFSLLDNKLPAGGWTIIVEAQFYLFFPFIQPTIEKKYRENGLLGVASYVVPFLVFSIFLRWGVHMNSGSAQMIGYWTIFGRIDQFLLGVTAFYVYRNVTVNWSARKSAICFSIVALFLLAFYRWFNSKGGYYSYGTYPSLARIWILLPTIEGTFYGLLIALYLPTSQKFNGRIAQLFSFVGTISFSVYLANFFMIPLLERAHRWMPFSQENTFNEFFLWGLFIGFPGICLFAAFTYHFIERPFLERRKKYTSSRSVDEHP